MFEKTAKKLAKEVGDKTLIPVKNLLDATKIRPFSLIRKKKPWSLFWGPQDIPLGVSLMQILEPSSVPDAVKVPFQFRTTDIMKQQVALSVDAGAKASFSERTVQRQGSSFDCHIVTIPQDIFPDIQKRKLKDPEESFLKQFRVASINLYVVTETVELLNTAVLQDSSGLRFLGKVSIPLNAFLKGKGQGGALRLGEKTLTVPQGSVLAYKRKQLVFKKEGWDILHVADDDEQETFQDVKVKLSCRSSTKELVWKPSCLDFKCLQEEVSQKVEAARLSKDIQDVVFSNIQAMLEDREALQDLMDTLEQDPFGHLNGPGGTILSELRQDLRDPWYASKQQLVLYLLEAIMMLSDIQHDLLAQSMEKKILAQQRDLVRSILEPHFECSDSIPFTLQPKLLAPLQEEDLAITYGLLGECGLKMELTGATWEPEAKERLSALYATLFALQRLAEA